VYEVSWDGPLRSQASEVAWTAWVAPEALRQMLAELTFCPDSREMADAPTSIGASTRPRRLWSSASLS
jgi:hypothetical protein